MIYDDADGHEVVINQENLSACASSAVSAFRLGGKNIRLQVDGFEVTVSAAKRPEASNQ